MVVDIGGVLLKVFARVGRLELVCSELAAAGTLAYAELGARGNTIGEGEGGDEGKEEGWDELGCLHCCGCISCRFGQVREVVVVWLRMKQSLG